MQSQLYENGENHGFTGFINAVREKLYTEISGFFCKLLGDCNWPVIT